MFLLGSREQRPRQVVASYSSNLSPVRATSKPASATARASSLDGFRQGFVWFRWMNDTRPRAAAGSRAMVSWIIGCGIAPRSRPGSSAAE